MPTIRAGNTFASLREALLSRYVVWLVLSLPALVLCWPVLSRGSVPGQFLIETGEWSVRLLILTLAITPLQRIFPSSVFVRWFVRRRRYFGVASFAYAALHTAFYVWDAPTLGWMLFVAQRLHAWNGWVAMGLVLILALSSNAFSQRVLGRNWKRLQRLTYFAALAAAVHWIILARFDREVIIQIGILVGLELIRLAMALRQWLSR